ncbi:MAG: histone deacetylase [Planctomycetaceae bacterium]|nr:histone deacetylase [Planctomycetaceae bacterium]
MHIAYDRRYNIGFHGFDQGWHPFDTQKFRRAWRKLTKHFGRRLRDWKLAVPREITREELLAVHSAEYLDSLGRSAVVARIVEVPFVAKMPALLLDFALLGPVRRQTFGSVVAARAALETGLAVNLGGGFHHAKPESGEGFCFYNDAAIAVALLRREGRLSARGRIAYIDLDVHQGNGISHCFLYDRTLFAFDMFNPSIYPCFDVVARARIDCAVPLPPHCSGDAYLRLLHEKLPGFLHSISQSEPVELAIYNAGTDVYRGDQLGGVECTEADVLERDLFVVEQLRSRGIPTLMLTGGGYSEASHAMIAATVQALCERYGDAGAKL